MFGPGDLSSLSNALVGCCLEYTEKRNLTGYTHLAIRIIESRNQKVPVETYPRTVNGNPVLIPRMTDPNSEVVFGKVNPV
jgi:hypothetical protein